jgi:hypothetical protein
MTDVLPHRLIEAVALLPVLYVPLRKEGFTVGAVGGMAAAVVAEVSRWPDLTAVYTTEKVTPLNRKHQVVEVLPVVDVLVLSPEQNPEPWVRFLKAGGILQAATADPAKFRPLIEVVQKHVGGCCPWREHLPKPLYGTIGYAGIGRPRTARKPPQNTKRLTEKYLPCLFTFGKDELPLAFIRSSGKVSGSEAPHG